MGLSYNIIPTSEMNDRKAYLEHFRTIETYQFPRNFKIDTKSKYPKLIEIESCIVSSGCKIESIEEEIGINQVVSRSYQLKYNEDDYGSDFTIRYDNEKVRTMMGVHGDFNILLRIATELTKLCGSMIIWSAYDAHYVEKGKSYEQIWDKLKVNWVGHE